MPADREPEGLFMLRGLFKKVTELFQRRTRLEESLYDELEEALIQADVGPEVAAGLVVRLRDAVKKNRYTTAEEAREWLQGDIQALLTRGAGVVNWAPEPPTLILVIGVNGTGKTTSIAKMAHYFKGRGNRVVLAAADTFRAAAIDQLEIWAERVGVDMIRHREGADPAAVVFDAIEAGKARHADIVIADTAGRLHNKTHLMAELQKIHRVAQRALGRPPDETLLVIDASVGQNGVNQAQSFTQAMPLTGVILTKLDGTARGGVVISIRDELGLPVKYVGTGEKLGDFAPFDPAEYAKGLFGE